MARSFRLALSFIIISPFIAGCPNMPAGTTPTSPGQAPKGPIGSSLSSATALTLDSNGASAIASTITGNKVDVYDLGSVSPGDHLVIAVKPTDNSNLDTVIAVFDTNEELFMLNDDVDTANNRIDSAIDDYVTIASPHYYLAVTKYFAPPPRPNPDPTDGDYTGTVTIQRGQTIPKPLPQILWLNFTGGTAVIPNVGTFNIKAFNAADLDKETQPPPYDNSQTAAIKAKIISVFKQKFENFGVTILSSDDTMTPGSNASTIWFGTFSNTKFGEAQDVDEGNRLRDDDGIIYTDDFVKPFASTPSPDGAATAIGQVAAHEAGHLLGLNHVADVTALMDTTGTASTLLQDQEFKTAPLHISIFPFGKQNDVTILNRVIPK